jgi:hypothetical protein
MRAHLRAAQERRVFRNLDVQETFDRIYAEGWWGKGADFDSGPGSADAIADAYVRVVGDFIAERGICSVADLGCGDFRVGQRLLSPDVDYIGVDIVEGLIERNRRLFADRPVRFEQRNVIADELPQAELALLRQVLQHLSNAEIRALLVNASHYRYLIVTEGLPVGDDVVPNLDMPHGPDIRMSERSGVFLDCAPYSLKTTTLLEVPYTAGQVLRTVLIENDTAQLSARDTPAASADAER